MDTAELVVFGHFISVLILGFGLQCVTSSRDLALHKNTTQSSTYSDVHNSFDAGRAVDGVLGRDIEGGHCSHTGIGHSQAWWKVDLGQVYRIQTINITYRHDYTYRLSGYYLYVTNDTHMTESNGGINASLGQLCYHDRGPGYPSYNQSRTCPVTGRYVIIYNKRPADYVPPDHNGYYSTTEAFIELCEVQVFRCPVGRFGDDCTFTCHCAEGGCDPDTGQCDFVECQTGWKGPTCYVPSSDLAYGQRAIQSSFNSNQQWDANKAVDGYPGEDSCSHTYPHAWPEAWWIVDLRQAHRINTINIVFAHKHQLIISGYSLYVSSSEMRQYDKKPPREAHLCYHDNTTTSDGPPPYRQSHQCSVTGRYVIVYNNRSSSLHSSPLNYSSEDAVVELCDVQVFSGFITTFGPNCSQVCHCMSVGCDPVSGACHDPGCQQGWTGDSCSTQDCQTGYFGPDCTTECHCKTGGCNVINGTCNTRGCQDGWRGDACNHECSSGHFGPQCSKVCHCQQEGCDHVHGKCQFAGCQPGWSGQACDQQCVNSTFGRDCNQTCHCANSGCDRVNGTCTVPGCTDGWTTATCSQECSSGHFGPQCSEVCNCEREGCDHVHGTCLFAGCQPGWSGQACDQQCVNSTFGGDCNQTCHCANSGCDRVNGTCTVPGCTDGWTTATCSQECSPGHFGPQCSEVCNCEREGCDHEHGKCLFAGCQPGWSGQACDQQCLNTTFGRDCNQTCHCANSGCDRMNGTCTIHECTEGWTTATCSQECVNPTFGRDCNQTCHCANSGCDRMNGTCDILGCTEGWIGDTCSQECSSGYFGLNCSKVCHCQFEGCDHVHGTCDLDGCQAGWSGQACDHQCVNITFGRDCNLTCNCASLGCNRTNGVCNSPGCSEGWMGNTCSQECGSHTFGRDCNQACHCANSDCDRVNGTCVIPGCTKGWIGHNCSHDCSLGYFGSHCSEVCHCQRQGCNHVDGRCDHVGCEAGWSGKACDQQCVNDTFGRDCGETCHCAISDCDRVSGICNTSECTAGWSGETCSHALPATSSESSPGSSALIGGVVAAVVAVLLVILIVVVVVRKRRIPSKERPVGDINISSDNHPGKNAGENVYVNIVTKDARKRQFEVKTPKVNETDIDEDEVIYVNGPNDADVRGDTKLCVTDLKETVTTKHENDMFGVEYKSLPHGLKHPHTNAKLEQNLLRNRFKTTFPYDHSRVVLKKERKGSTDYINANYIDGVRNQKTYIATQGPKTMTLEEFWRMAWQNNCGKIVMLANLVEVGKVKCTTYWTGSDGNPLELGLFQVTLQEEVAYAFYTIRKLVVKNKQTNSTRQISQYHFTRWPDHGVPEPFELLQFYKRVRSDHTDHKGPLIVHCSAGIGRTGSFIGLDALLLEGNTSGEIDVFAYTEKMRKDRMNMIQTAEQYAMLHDVLLEGLTVVTSSMSKTDFSRVTNDMDDDDIPTQQYSLLNSARPGYSTIEYKTALQNKQKNRDQSILAVEKYKIRLMTTASGYINAVNIPGYRIPYGYILTQHPLDNTVIDFLSLIAQERSNTVVSIGLLQNNPCWPTKHGSQATFGDFVVTSVHCDHHSVGPERVEERHLRVVNKETGTDTKITLFETPSWGSSLPNFSFMLELIQVIQSRRGIDASPVIITCSDGATESGLLCGLCNVMERLEVDGDVDIMAAARQLQIRRPQCFPNKDQFVFCYTLVKEHLEASTVYANV